MTKKSDEHFSDKEAQERFEAALRGGLKTPHKPLTDIPKKRVAKKTKPKKRAKP